MHELCEFRGNCPARCNGGWCVVVKETFLNDPDYASTCSAEEVEQTTPEPTIVVTDPLMNCVTEWRCVPRGDDFIVARLNYGEVECMEKPNATKDGQCYWGPVCDETMRPLIYVENYWTMDQLCELRGNCPARCNGGWCKIVKDTFMEEPEYSQCVTEYDMFVVNGDCKVEENCVSSSNYPQSYMRGESCMVTLKEDLYLTPGVPFEISDPLRSGDVDIVSTLQMPTSLSEGESITWSTYTSEYDHINTRAGWKVCFTREEPPMRNDRFHIEGDGCVADTFGCVYTKNYPGQYIRNEMCSIQVLQDSNVQTNSELAMSQDALTIAGQDVNYVEEVPAVMRAGDIITWETDGTREHGFGWQLCFREFENSYFALNGDGCEIVDDCVQSMGFPESYSPEQPFLNRATSCRVEVLADIDIASVYSVDVADDVLTVDGNAITNTDQIPESLTAGAQITWAMSGQHTSSQGWKICVNVDEGLSNCVTEWRCVDSGNGDILVARLNHGNVECMEKPNPKKDGQCYRNPECDETMRPLIYTDNYWTMDQLCEIRGNCPARCQQGWCKAVKDTFENDPDYSECAN